MTISKAKNKLIFHQEGLFHTSINVSEPFRKAISEAIRKSQYSREQIIAMIDVLTGMSISKNILDQTTSSKSEYRFPAEILHAFCSITGSIEPFNVLLNSIGCEVIGPKEAKELRLFRLMRDRDRLNMEITKLKLEIENGGRDTEKG